MEQNKQNKSNSNNTNPRQKINKRKTGAAYERRAREYLVTEGLEIIEMNFYSHHGEIDIIGLDNDTYVFIEVKYRKNDLYGIPAMSVTQNKQRMICRTAAFYMQNKKLPINGSFRFDVVSILGNTITWYKNAFPYRT